MGVCVAFKSVAPFLSLMFLMCLFPINFILKQGKSVLIGPCSESPGSRAGSDSALGFAAPGRAAELRLQERANLLRGRLRLLHRGAGEDQSPWTGFM